VYLYDFIDCFGSKKAEKSYVIKTLMNEKAIQRATQKQTKVC